jgi:hypothetical protein
MTWLLPGAAIFRIKIVYGGRGEANYVCGPKVGPFLMWSLLLSLS